MTFPVDPSPFVLAAGMTKVKPPEEGGMISVEAVGLINDGGVALHRLYLPGGEAFFMLHLGRDGAPDECRYFTLLDRITPASRDEWAFWLDPAQGMIGWPQFETKDGKTYDRVWAPGSSRVQPRQQVETLQGYVRDDRAQDPSHAIRCPYRRGTACAGDRVCAGVRRRAG